LAAIVSLKAFARENYEIDKFKAYNQDFKSPEYGFGRSLPDLLALVGWIGWELECDRLGFRRNLRDQWRNDTRGSCGIQWVSVDVEQSDADERLVDQ
jgi:hypothetical protein